MELLIARFSWGIFNVLLDDKQNIVELQTSVEDGNDIGTIYVGRVEQIKTNINSAFIRVSDGRKVFMSIQAEEDLFYTKKIGNSDKLVQGDELLVQIEKEAHKTKLAKATGSFVISGRYVVLTTDKKKIFVSSKINDEALRKTYKFKLKSMVTKEFGFIVRTNAQFVSMEEIEAEILDLSAQYEEIMAHLPYKQVFQKIYRPLPKYLSMIRDRGAGNDLKIKVCEEDLFLDVQQYLRDSGLTVEVVKEKSMTSKELIDAYCIKDKILKLQSKKVWLKSGATIVIEPTEAMTVIDVNTEKTLSKKKSDETILKTNMEAADMIIYQIRARNISGIIIVDFIDMKDVEHREQLIQYLTHLCGMEPVKTTLHGMTTLGLIELTRKKLEKPLWENEMVKKLLDM